jgi:hypothetical protein
MREAGHGKRPRRLKPPSFEMGSGGDLQGAVVERSLKARLAEQRR